MKRSAILLGLSICFFGVNAQTLQQVTDNGASTTNTLNSLNPNGFQVTGTTGSPAYFVIDQSINSGGKRWRFGHTGAATGFDSFDVSNITDGITPLSMKYNGYVGIGTTTPTSNLTVEVGTNKRLGIENIANSSIAGFLDGGAAITFSRANDGVDRLHGIYSYIDNANDSNLGLSTRGDLVVGTGGTSTYNYAPERMRIKANGNIGIGTTAPSSKLHVSGLFSRNEYGIISTALNVYSTEPASVGTGGTIALGGKSGNNVEDFPFAYILGGKGSNNANDYGGYFAVHTVSSGGNGEANSGNYERLRITSNGDVGIGTSDPRGYRLAVNGKIRAQEIKVEASPWPDYVFAKDYSLPTLQETEKHIKEKGHLPDIPSAEEVKANGIDLGEMNAKLLRKIEELTLHLIEKDKEIKQLGKLNDRVAELELKMSKLINKL